MNGFRSLLNENLLRILYDDDYGNYYRDDDFDYTNSTNAER